MNNAAFTYTCSKSNFQSSQFRSNHYFSHPKTSKRIGRHADYVMNPCNSTAGLRRKLSVLACSSTNNNGGDQKKTEEKRSFLSLEEAGLVEMSGLSSHERFLCRLTISSLNLLRVISEQEGCSIEELNAGRVCDWFLKDKLKREQNLGSAVLQWDDPDFQF